MRCALATVLAALMLVATATSNGADAAPASWGIEQLMQRFAQVKSAKAAFVERKHMRVLTGPLESSGTLVYTAP